MIAFLKEHGEAQTAEIIEAMRKALPHANPTRAQVQDVLQNEPEFASSKKGVWGLAASTNPAVKPAVFYGGSAVKRTVVRTPEEEQTIKELLG